MMQPSEESVTQLDESSLELQSGMETDVKDLELQSGTETDFGDSRQNEHADLLSRVNDVVVWNYLALSVTVWLVVPALISGMIVAFLLLRIVWICVLFAPHLTISLIKARHHVMELIKNTKNDASKTRTEQASYRASDKVEKGETSGDERDDDEPPVKKCPPNFWVTSLPSLMDIVFFGAVYPLLMMVFRRYIFTDEDGTTVVEWTSIYRSFTFIIVLSCMIVILRVCIGTKMILSRRRTSTSCIATAYNAIGSIPVLNKGLDFVYFRFWLRFKIWCSTPSKFLGLQKLTTTVAVVLSVLWLGWSIILAVLHVGRFEPVPYVPTTACDPLDATECVLPFPSSYHLRQDDSTASGYRLNVKPETLPALKGPGKPPMSVDFLNKMDGFSTMGPLLFYMDGIKESHEAYVQAVQENPTLKTEAGVTRLRGHEELELSVTPYSTTLLLDVDNQILVPHSAEIDYLDPERPLVMVFPAKPLRHNTHYALAVINATDIDGNRLPPTQGMIELFEQKNDPRYQVFTEAVLPALEDATRKQSEDTGHSWAGPDGAFLRSGDGLGGLQLLFDFRTTSSESQLGAVRAVRDNALAHVDANWSWDDDTHVRVVRQIEGSCEDPHYPVARTLHIELDVPWFMTDYGSGYRGALLDQNAVENGVPTGTGIAKCLVYVPCSLKQSALDQTTSTNATTAKPLRAVMEYGHGLFGSKLEASDPYLQRMAHESGYIIAAMDWRGMSKYDLPTLARTMVSEPSLFESIRDNLIQGYANKFVLQHFIHNGMLEKEWLQFQTDEAGDAAAKLKIPHHSEAPLSVFYGISQGGILGAGYVGLSAATGFISRATLNAPGIGFAFVLSQSEAFAGYNLALRTNFQTSRHVRIFLSLAQMCWDSVEATGVLAEPLEAKVPPVLLQTGLGDNVVPALTAETLGRALGAHTLPQNPREIFGIPVSEPDEQTTTLQEIMYEEDFADLTASNKFTSKHNWVHDVARLDPTFQIQASEFFNSGRIINPCGADGTTSCIREKAREPTKCIDAFDTKQVGSDQIQFCE